MKFKDIARIGINRANNQYSLNLRSKQLKKIGITPEQLLELTIPESKKFNVRLKKEYNLKGGVKKYGKNKI